MKVERKINEMLDATGKGSRALRRKGEKFMVVHEEHLRNLNSANPPNHRSATGLWWYDQRYNHEQEMKIREKCNQVFVPGSSRHPNHHHPFVFHEGMTFGEVWGYRYTAEDIAAAREILNVVEFRMGNYGEIKPVFRHTVLEDAGYFNFADLPELKDVCPAARAYDKVRGIISEIQRSATDEHGFQCGSEFDKAGRGYAINTDIYDIDVSGQNGTPLAVIQVRMWEKRTRNGYPNVRKNYFLVGRNENGVAFAHPIPSVRRWTRENWGDLVRRAQAWVWDVSIADLEKIQRCGDTALLPVSSPPDVPTLPEKKIALVDSHVLSGREIRRNGQIYVLSGRISHRKRQHPSVRVSGWSVALIGRRAETHDFANPTVD